MTATTNRQTAGFWFRGVAAGVGAAVAASAVAIGLAAAAQADPIADVLGAAEVPLLNAQSLIDVASGTLSAVDMAVLSGQSQVIDAQEQFLTQLQTLQESFTTAQAIDLADLDKLLITANNSLLDHTAEFLSAAEIDGPVAHFFTGLDLLNADLSVLTTDFEVLLGSFISEYFGPVDLSGLLLS